MPAPKGRAQMTKRQTVASFNMGTSSASNETEASQIVSGVVH